VRSARRVPAPDESVVLVEGPWTHRTVRANGIALHIAEIGTGPLVLFLHGFPQFWWTWHRQLIDLADAGYRAVAVDLRGFGASDKTPRGYDSPNVAADIAALVTALGERDATIVGNDLGGLLAWTVATAHPQVVRRLVVVGAAHPLRLRQALVANPTGQGRASAYAVASFQLPRRPEARLSDGNAASTAYVRGLFDEWTGPRWQAAADYDAAVERYTEALRIWPVAHCALEYFRWLVRSQLRPDGLRYAASMRRPVRVPVLQLHGSADRCVLPQTAQGSGRYVNGDYEWHQLERVGHYPQDEDPDRVSAELIRWAKTT
jgi:pimeloyl-ACP methyl ester carboxylesterase